MIDTRKGAALLEEAELIVVGAGPAGSSCAARAAERGLDVVIVDQDEFPRDKACGDAVTREGVAFLEELGLKSSMDKHGLPIAAARLVVSHGYELEAPLSRGPALCMAREDLDAELLDAAKLRGARFVRGKVGRVVGSPPRMGVELATPEPAYIAGKQIVAADGATSRLRDQSGLSSRPLAPSYAVRQYVETERAAEPVFEMHVPISLAGHTLLGYGWLFPLGGKRANVGIGFMRYPADEPVPTLTAVLSSFIDSLQASRGLGRIRRIGRPRGSPVASNFSANHCERDGLLLSGDAAQTVDPFTGEGIAQALQGGALVADIVYETLRGNRRARRIGPSLSRRFPRLGPDLRLPLRLTSRLLDATEAGSPKIPSLDFGSLPLLRELAGLIGRPDVDPSLKPTPVMELLDADPELSRSLEEANEVMLDSLKNELPLATDLLTRKFRDPHGPSRITMCLLVAKTIAGGVRRTVVEAGLALEAARLADRMVAAIPTGGGSLKNANSTLAVALADLCMARAGEFAANCEAGALGRVGAAIASLAEGRRIEIEDAFDVDRPDSRYLQAAGHRASLFEEAARIGAQTASREVASSLAAYGRELGLAFEIAEDLHNLLDSSESGSSSGRQIRRGFYALPVIHALRVDPGLRKLLAAPDVDPAAALKAVAATGGILKAVETCQSYVEKARQKLPRKGDLEFDRLDQFAFLPLFSARSLLGEIEPATNEVARSFE